MEKKRNRSTRRQSKATRKGNRKWDAAGIFSFLLVGGFLLWRLEQSLEPWWLETKGACIKAVILEETEYQGKGMPRTFRYRFELANKDYIGDSKLTDRNRIGDSICVMYLASLPAIHRAAAVFKKLNFPCECLSK